MKDPRLIVARIESDFVERRIERIARAVAAAGMPAIAAGGMDAEGVDPCFADIMSGKKKLEGFGTVNDGSGNFVTFNYKGNVGDDVSSNNESNSAKYSIKFGLLGNKPTEWGYSVCIGDKYTPELLFPTCDEAWKSLLNGIGEIIKDMSVAYDEIARENGQRGDAGKYSLTQAGDEKFEKIRRVWSNVDSDPELRYRLTFEKYQDVSDKQFADAIDAVYQKLYSFDEEKKTDKNGNTYILVQLNNANSLEPVRQLLRSCGFSVKK